MKGQSARVYIAALNALKWEGRLTGRSDFWVVGSAGSGETALSQCRALEPDALILEAALPGMDSLALLKILGDTFVAPPRVLYVWPGSGGEAWQKEAQSAGVEAAVGERAGEAALEAGLDALSRAMNRPPCLAQSWEETRLQIAGDLLHRLGMPDGFKGRAYIRYAAAALACAPQLAQSYAGRLYPLVGEAYGATPRAVERSIRTAIEYTWLNGDLSAIGDLFGLSVDADKGKPTNAECLSMLSVHVGRLLRRKMLEAQEQ